MKPKKWLDERIKATIIEMAQEHLVTASYIANELELPPQRLNDLTKRFWNLSPTAVIRKVKKGELKWEN